jgi:integrase/recombinase XerD
MVATRHDTPTTKNIQQAFRLFDQAVERFLISRKTDNTRQAYGLALKLYRAYAARQELDPLRADALIAYNRFANERRGELSNDTIRARLKAVQSLFSWLYRWGLSPLKPDLIAKDILDMPPAKKLSPRDILTIDEARRLLAAAEGQRDRCLIQLMLDDGLRVSEALALTWDNIYSALDRYYVDVIAGKGNKTRMVETPAGLWHALVAYRDNMQARSQSEPWLDASRPFAIHRTTAWRIVDRTAGAAGLEKTVTPHSLRHTHAHQLRMAGWPLEMIADRLGHKSLNTTQVYTRPAEMAAKIKLPAMPWSMP